MSLKAIVSLSFFSSQTAVAQPSMCANLIGTCAYYDCVEANLLSCGSSGYTLNFGKFYCEKFKLVVPIDFLTPHEQYLFPTEWDKWLDKTAVCLHAAIDNYIQSTEAPNCTDLREAAFASHTQCYTSQPSFCFLPPRQTANIGRIISGRGLATHETQNQIRQTANICTDQYSERIAAEPSPLAKI